MPDRRTNRRDPLYVSRRRYPRVFLDVDWFVESRGCSTLGRGLELSLRGALLPIVRTAELAEQVVLHVALPGRPRLFRAQASASPRHARSGWLLRFHEVSDADRHLLARSLIEEFGLGAIPNLDRRFGRYTGLDRRHLRDSI